MGDRLRTPDAVANIEGGHTGSLELALKYCRDGSLFITACSGSDNRFPAHPAVTGYWVPWTTWEWFPRLPLPLIDRATDASRQKLQSLCVNSKERHGPHSQPKKVTSQAKQIIYLGMWNWKIFCPTPKKVKINIKFYIFSQRAPFHMF